MTVTLTQIADAAGCSLPTASRVFRDPHLVAESTRRRVLTTARELGYEPRRLGLPKTTGTLGFVGSSSVGILENPWFAELVTAVVFAARQRNIAVYLAEPERDPLQEEDILGSVMRLSDALILWSPTLTGPRLREISARIPTVVVNLPTPGCINLVTKNELGIHQAAEHLRALGHTRCGFVAVGGESWTIAARSRAIRTACAEHRIELVEFGPYDSQFESGVQAADSIIAAGLTAVITQNDVSAQGLLRQLAIRGVRVPDDISVIGGDDCVIARRTLPTLTTVRIPIDKIVTPAISIIANILAGRTYPDPPSIDIPTSLIVRDSTGPAPARVSLSRRDHSPARPATAGASTDRPSHTQ